MSEKKTKYSPKMNTVATIIVSFAFGFLVSYFTAPFIRVSKDGVEYCVSTDPHLEKLFKTHKLLRRCTANSRELNFLEKGGEYFADYENPRSFNDKIAYVLHNYFNKSPVTSYIGNKYFAKEYVAQAVGEEHVVKLINVWDNPADIEWSSLPSQFVLKAVRGHFGKQVILVKDKSKLNIPATIKKLEKYCQGMGNIGIKTKRIIAEEYLEQPDNTAVTDYKFFCSYGKVLFAYCLENKNTDNCYACKKSLSFYSIPDWTRLPITVSGHLQNLVSKPRHFDKMIKVAQKLSEPFSLIRIDLYVVRDRVLVGELTEDSGGAKNILYPVIWDFILGEMIQVPSLGELEKRVEKDKKKYGSVIGR